MAKGKENPKRYYWDACVFLSGINGPPERIPIVEGILDDSDQGRVVIYTSILSIAEVAFAEVEKNNQMVDGKVQEKIDKLWLPSSPINLIEVNEFVLWDARDLIRKGIKSGRVLKPADAIHLATANRLRIDAVHTYDKPLLNCSGSDLAKYPIQQPTITDRFIFTVDEASPLPKTEPSTSGEAEKQNGQVKAEQDSNVLREGDRGPALHQAQEETPQKEQAK